jgi:4-hydroxybenzoate polyprenyltransferase
MGKKILLVLTSVFWGFILAMCIYVPDMPHRCLGFFVCSVLLFAGFCYVIIETWDSK